MRPAQASLSAHHDSRQTPEMCTFGERYIGEGRKDSDAYGDALSEH